MSKDNITVCMISCLHSLYDDRIYWKEALSLKNLGYNVIHLGLGKTNSDVISNEGIQLITLKRITYFANPFIDKLYRKITLKKNVYKYLFLKAKELTADIYHLHDLQLNRIGHLLKKLEHNPKVIYDVHEPYPVTIATTNSKNPVVNLIWKIYATYIHFWEIKKSKRYDLIIATEENVQKKFLKYSNKPVEIVYNYVDINRTSTSIKKEYDFIYCGGIRKRRGIFQILKATEKLKSKGLNIKVLVIGHIHDKGLQYQITDFIQHHNLTSNIVLKKHVPYNEIVHYYNISKIGLAIFNEEKVNKIIMPIKIFEYIVMGLPVITSNFGHMKHITENNNTGITVDPNNIDAISVAMEKFITNNEFYSTIVENCKNASGKYRWGIMEEKLIQLYSKLVTRHI